MKGVERPSALRWLHGQLMDELVVAGLGNPSYDLFNAGDRPQHFYMWGAMGCAPSVGLGVALAAPDATVIAMEGDGGVLMNLGALSTIGWTAPSNLVVIVWDNGILDLTGGQSTATGAGTDLAAVARACGVAQSRRISTMDEFQEGVTAALDAPGPWCLIVDTAPTPPTRRKPLVALRRRFIRLDDFIDAAIASRRTDPGVRS